MGETEPSMDQLSQIMDGILQCGVRRLGLAHNGLDKQGVALVARYLGAKICEGLELGGNDLSFHVDVIDNALKGNDALWALSIAGCNLNPSSLVRILPTLVALNDFRFIDLSHNPELFQSTPSVVGLLRRYLPQMRNLKRIHLQDVNMTAEQAIALVEILPEVCSLAHINLLGNTYLESLANAKMEEAQEEACALYASLLAATRISKSLICVDIEVPGAEAGEIVKAMAEQVVAYCLRNMERIPDTDIGAAMATALAETRGEVRVDKLPAYHDVLIHLVGHGATEHNEGGDESEAAADDDYVIGGTGVVKALTCCLENRGDESGRATDEAQLKSGLASTMGNEPAAKPSLAAAGKAKDMSKHLLAGARKIRVRLQPALNKARANSDDEQNLRKLVFLDNTLQGIIKRFEDEFSDTREPEAEQSSQAAEEVPTVGSAGNGLAVAILDAEEDFEPEAPKRLSRTNSELSKVFAGEEGQVHRVGHRFRSGFVRQEHIDMLQTIDDIGADPKHARMLEGLADDLGGELLEKVKEKGAVRAFKEDKETLLRSMRESDPDHWDRFVEAQQKARANMLVSSEEKTAAGREAGLGGEGTAVING